MSCRTTFCRARHIRVVVAFVLSFAPAGMVQATTLWVAPCGSDGWVGVSSNCAAPLGPKRTIQAAIDAAASGDTIKVLPGVYVGTIDLDGKALTLESIGGAATTFMHGNGVGPVVTCNSLEGPSTVIRGFTITGGDSAGHGGGALLALSAPTITACVFASNTATGSGGGLYAVNASPTLTDCTFDDNSALHGGGAYFKYGQPTLTDCSFTACSSQMWGGGVVLDATVDAAIVGGTFDSNSAVVGGGLYASFGNVAIDHSGFEGNAAVTMGGGVALHAMDKASVVDCTLRSNTVGVEGTMSGGGLYVSACAPTITGCLFDQNDAPKGGAAALDDANGTAFTGSTFTANQSTSCCGASAVEVRDSELSFFGCSFGANVVSQYGGAISVLESSVTLTWCGFHENLSPDWIAYGAAIYAANSTVEAYQSTFTNNVSGGGIGGGGGAVFCIQSTMRLEGCAFQGNSTPGAGAGGAVLLQQGTLLLDTCAFTGNTGDHGGAVHALEGAQLDIRACTFESNVAVTGSGGAVQADSTPTSITGSTFESNQAGYCGGAVDIEATADRLELVDNTFIANTAVSGGGGVCTTVPTTIVGCRFSGNVAQDAGGLAAVGPFAEVQVHASRFVGNQATRAGAAIMNGAFSAGSHLLLMNSIVANNASAFMQGAVHESVLGATTHIVNSVIVNNDGSGLRIDNGATQARIANSIVRGNFSGTQLAGIMPTVLYSNVQGGAPGIGNLDADPMFVNPAAGEFALAVGSPCIDAGHNHLVPADAADLDDDGNLVELVPLDFAGSPRFMDEPASEDQGCGGPAIVDIGPYETIGSVADDVVLGDIDQDGAVNVADLLILLAAWGPCVETCCPADFNLDGMVDVSDLLVMLLNWG